MSATDQPTKKRKRMHYACVECNRRKHKCDRKIPCAPCVQRGLADACRPFEDGDEHGDLRARLARVEHLLDSLIARENHPGPGSPPVTGPDARSRSSPTTTAEEREEHLDGGLNGVAGSYFGGNALPSVTSTSIEAEIRGGANAPHPPPTISARTTQANLALRQAITEDACSPDILLTLLSELPPKDDIAALLDIFFRDINPVRFPLPENDIRRAFDDLNAFTWGPAHGDGDNGATHILFLPLLFMIIATTTFCLPLTMSKRINVKSQARRYYHSYRRAASIASLLPATMTLVCAHLLAARFLIINRTPADGWSLLGATLRLAQALGLHRDGARLGLPAAETERRRRLWAHLFYADASMCLMLGRPMGVRVGDCDVLPPGSVKLDEDVEDEIGEWTHGERPTRWTFIALRHRLAHITARVIDHFQDLAGGRHYDTVIELDRELVAFSESLPAVYKPDGGEKLRELLERGRPSHDRSKDCETTNEETADDATRSPQNGQPSELGEAPGVYPFLALHRFMINTEIQYVRITLHRPYVLRMGEKYFIQMHANQSANDVTSAREVKIIQLFRAKADDALRLRSPMKPGSAPQMTSHPPNQITTVPRPPRSSRGFTIDSPFPSSASRASPPHGHRRPRSTTSVSSMTISTPNMIDNPPLPPGLSPTASFAPASFGSPTATFAVSNNRRASSATLSPTTPREAQGLLSPAPRAVSPLLMLGLGANADGTPPSNFNPLGNDALPFADDTQALFDQASWQYALANQGMSLGFDWSNLSSAGSGLGLGLGELGVGVGIDTFGFVGGNGYGPSVAGSSTAGSNAGEEAASPSAVFVTNVAGGPDTPEGLLAPASEEHVRRGSGRGQGRAPEGWGYWEGLVDAIVNQQGIGGRE
ncbi:hypothetical protein FRC06_006231 [Ceratobasidium sp. 370]|nr:hypothetical protein FRC06_006231 [Ceratobasidium sp. 370]